MPGKNDWEVVKNPKTAKPVNGAKATNGTAKSAKPLAKVEAVKSNGVANGKSNTAQV